MQGKARQGKARQGKARQGKARQGKTKMTRVKQGIFTGHAGDVYRVPYFPVDYNIPYKVLNLHYLTGYLH